MLETPLAKQTSHRKSHYLFAGSDQLVEYKQIVIIRPLVKFVSDQVTQLLEGLVIHVNLSPCSWTWDTECMKYNSVSLNVQYSQCNVKT